MKRLLLSLAAIAVVLPAAAQQPIVLKFNSPAPPRSFLHDGAFTPWAKAVSEDSAGTLQVETYFGGTLGNFGVTYDRVVDGVADIGFILTAFAGGKFRSLDVAALPFESKSSLAASNALWHLYEKGVMASEFDAVKPLGIWTFPNATLNAKSQVKSLDDLKGKPVVSTTGTTNFRLIRVLSQEKSLDIDLLGAKDHTESALMVQTGRALAFAMDDILLYGLRASAQNPADFAVVGEALQVEPYAIMLRKDDPAFKKLVDDTLAGLMKSGEFTKLYTKWFMSPIPPKGINLNAPMSQELIDNMKALSDKPAT